MEPVDLILSALVAGAAAGFKDSASSAVKDAYSKFRSLLSKRVKGDQEAETALERHEADPVSWRESLGDGLVRTGAVDDASVLEAAALVLRVLGQGSGGKHQVHVEGDVHGLAQGDHQIVTMNFGTPPER